MLNLCQYGNGTTITVVDSQGKVVKDDLPAKAEADGGTAVLNYEGPTGQLKFTFATQAYLHKVTVYNVSDFLAKDENSGYYIVPATLLQQNQIPRYSCPMVHTTLVRQL